MLEYSPAKTTIFAVFLSLSCAVWGQDAVQWTPADINQTIGTGQGASDPVTATFISATPLSNVTFFIVPELGPFVAVSPTNLVEVQANTPYQLTLRFSIPMAAAQGAYTGTIHILEGARTVPQPLKITVNVSYGQNLVAPATKVLSLPTVQFLASISPDRSTLTFSQNTPELALLGLGAILILPDSPTSPGGFLGRTTGITQAGSSIVIRTIPASLADAFINTNVSISRNLTPAAAPTSQTAGVLKAAFAGTGPSSAQAQSSTEFDLNLNHIVLYDVSGQQVWIDGSVSVNPSFNFNLSIQGSSLTQLTFVNTSTLEANLTLTAGLQLSVSKSVTLANYPLTPITIWAGFVPIVVVPQLAITAGVDGTVSVGMSMSATQTATLSAGLEFANGMWQPVAKLSNSFTFQPPQPAATASADVFVGPQLDLLIYDVVGPFVGVRPSVELDLSAFTEPQYQLFGELNVAGGVLVQVFDETLADEEDPAIIGYKLLLTQGDFPPLVTSVTPNPLSAPSTPTFLSGVFIISGANFFGGTITTDGPLVLVGPSTVNSTGTIISQPYQIGCCAPQQGQEFHLFVNTSRGSRSIADTINLTRLITVQFTGTVSFIRDLNNRIPAGVVAVGDQVSCLLTYDPSVPNVDNNGQGEYLQKGLGTSLSYTVFGGAGPQTFTSPPPATDGLSILTALFAGPPPESSLAIGSQAIDPAGFPPTAHMDVEFINQPGFPPFLTSIALPQDWSVINLAGDQTEISSAVFGSDWDISFRFTSITQR